MEIWRIWEAFSYLGVGWKRESFKSWACSLGGFLHLSHADVYRPRPPALAHIEKCYLKENFSCSFQKNEKLISTYIGSHVPCFPEKNIIYLILALNGKWKFPLARIHWKQIKRIKEVINQRVLKHLFPIAQNNLQLLFISFSQRRFETWIFPMIKTFNCFSLQTSLVIAL